MSRRVFLQASGVTASTLSAPLVQAQVTPPDAASPASTRRLVNLSVNGTLRELTIEPRVTLLDALREVLALTGTKKGCDRGQCGACTVLVDGRRINACLTLAVMHEGHAITTIEGLGTPRKPHPMQLAFVNHDAFQCGYCTPGQICSAVALLDEARAGRLSTVTFMATPGRALADAVAPRSASALGEAEIRERMSGNICRCGAYNNIVQAVRAVALGQPS